MGSSGAGRIEAFSDGCLPLRSRSRCSTLRFREHSTVVAWPRRIGARGPTYLA